MTIDFLGYHTSMIYIRSLSQQLVCLNACVYNITEEHYKPLYYALFESHMTYCITVFGTISKTCSEKQFKIQKHCIRILFGYLKKYLDNFRTSARTRPFEHTDSELNSFAKNIPNRCLTNYEF